LQAYGYLQPLAIVSDNIIYAYTKQLLELYASLMEDVPASALDTWIPPQLL